MAANGAKDWAQKNAKRDNAKKVTANKGNSLPWLIAALLLVIALGAGFMGC